jgi:hypothetical protein
MSNHFHALVRVLPTGPITDLELVTRAARFYGRRHPYVLVLREALAGGGVLPRDLRAGLCARMGDVSVFMKELKQRFSKWFNRRGERYGTLWAERFKSVLVEDAPGPIQAVAAYIDLNPVRAGLVEDPKRYRWCGYGEAMGGSHAARRGLGGFHEHSRWETVAAAYRQVLMVTSGSSGSAGKVSRDPKVLRRELQRGGQLPLGEVLRLRVRYFSDGVVLGSREYVNAVFAEFRERFGPKRRTGARPMRSVAGLGAWSTVRDLQVDVVG